jgi:hypothetical protein
MFFEKEKGKEKMITQNLKRGEGTKGREEDYRKLMFF